MSDPPDTGGPGEVAIASALRDPAVTGAIVGVRNPNQLNDIVGTVDLDLSTDEIVEIEKNTAEEKSHAGLSGGKANIAYSRQCVGFGCRV
jgi:Aldo/keto reductase family